MKNLKPFVFIVLSALLLGLFLAACGGKEEPTPQPEPTAVPPTTAPEPTDVPAPTEEPTAVPEPTDAPEPTEEPAAAMTDLTSAEGGFSLQYPADWYTADLFGFTIIASAEDLLDTAEPGAEGAVVMVLSGPTDEFESDDPLTALNMAIDESIVGNDMEVVDGPTAVTIQGQDAAVATVKGTADDGTPQTGYMALIIGQGDGAGRAGIVIGMAPAEMEDEFLPIFKDIANTVAITAAAEVESGGGAAATEGIPESQGFLLYGDTVSGEVAAGDVSAWEFIGLEGEMIDIVVTPDDTLDAVVNVLDESGASILENGEVDDNFDTEEILGLTLPADGTYYIVVRGFADGGGTYELTIGEAGAVTAPPAGGDSGGIAYGETVSGTVSEPGAISSWTFTAVSGDLVGLVVKVFGDLDAVIDMVDAGGVSLLETTRDTTLGNENLLVEIPADGDYTIQVAGFEDSTGSFDLTLGYPMSNSVFASAELTEDEVDAGQVYPFIALAGNMVGIIVSPEEGLDTAVLVEQDGVVVEGIGYAAERGFDTLDGENYVFIAPEDGVYQFVVKNSVDTEFGGNTGTYDVGLHSSGNTIFELADQDTTVAITDGSGFVEYAIRGLAGQTLTLKVEPYTEFDAVVMVTDADGNLLQEETDAAGAGEIETLTYTFDEEATIFIQVHDAAGAAGAVYVMTVSLQ
ncbi:MAG TPA: hypothetical protein EYP41_14760 [Anaerolineae bacterium]|nr:hypothetical protein [Anaerolineae bacterium]